MQNSSETCGTLQNLCENAAAFANTLTGREAAGKEAPYAQVARDAFSELRVDGATGCQEPNCTRKSRLRPPYKSPCIQSSEWPVIRFTTFHPMLSEFKWIWMTFRVTPSEYHSNWANLTDMWVNLNEIGCVWMKLNEFEWNWKKLNAFEWRRLKFHSRLEITELHSNFH